MRLPPIASAIPSVPVAEVRPAEAPAAVDRLEPVRAVAPVDADALRHRALAHAAEVFRGTIDPQLRATAQRLESTTALPPELRNALADVRRRRDVLARLPYPPPVRAEMDKTLDAYAAMAVLDAVMRTPHLTLLHAAIVGEPGVTPGRGNDPALGSYQTAIAKLLPTRVLDALADTMPELNAPMPVLDALIDELARSQPLADANVCVLGHVLAEAPNFLKALRRLGADPATTRLAPVPYSSNGLAMHAVRRLGYDVIEVNAPPPRITRFNDLSFYERPGGSEQLRGILETGRNVVDFIEGFHKQFGKPNDELLWKRLDDAVRSGHDVVTGPRAGFDFTLHDRLVFPKTFADIKEEQVKALLAKAVADHQRNGKRIVIIDDGGYALGIMQKHFRAFVRVCQVVEQTTRGIRRTEALERVDVPVVNVAESDPKRIIEAPFVADACTSAVAAHLRPIFGDHAPGEPAMLLGYGTIGAPIAKVLRSMGFVVTIYDPSPKARAQALADGFAVTDDPDAAIADQRVVIGSTGGPSVLHELMGKARSGTVFGSVSSANVEMFATHWAPWGSLDVRTRGVIDLKGEGTQVVNAPAAYADYFRYALAPKKPWIGGDVFDVFLVLNGGFPLNLTRQLVTMPPERIQVTLACLAAGAAQTTTAADIIPLAMADRISRLYAELG